jgi:hypothetical protein
LKDSNNRKNGEERSSRKLQPAGLGRVLASSVEEQAEQQIIEP